MKEKLELAGQFIDIFCPILNKSVENPDSDGLEFKLSDESGKPIIEVRLEGDAYESCRTEDGYKNICRNLACWFAEGYLAHYNLN